MKARGTSIRFILVSATVPNIQDVADWIGRGPNGGSAIVRQVGAALSSTNLAHVQPHKFSSENNSGLVNLHAMSMASLGNKNRTISNLIAF